jgi:DNA-nicking Smr family endonuclease
MSRRASDEPSEDRELFERAMRDVDRIEERPAELPRRRSKPPGPSGAGAARDGRERPAARLGAPGCHPRLEITRAGERIEGRLPGFAPRQMRALGAGEMPVELTIDLHGYPESEARGTLRDGLRRARRAGMRCVRVVHGRGLRSAAGPVLKEALPGWLSEEPVAAWLLGFISAPPRLGGTGATLVLLRSRSGRRSGAPD